MIPVAFCRALASSVADSEHALMLSPPSGMLATLLLCLFQSDDLKYVFDMRLREHAGTKSFRVLDSKSFSISTDAVVLYPQRQPSSAVSRLY